MWRRPALIDSRTTVEGDDVVERIDICRGDEAYPASFHALECPPEVIHLLGDPAVLEGDHLSVIGARKATPYGLATSAMAGRIAAECGITVVSGGALGCDSASLRAAHAAGGKTIVVSGVGADLIYPASSRDVFENALADGGAIVSLTPWGQDARKWSFLERNPIIAALGGALFVCEAGQRSGTSSTAEAAAKMGKRVYAVPGPIFSPQSMGTNRLIADGAAIVCCEQDLETMLALDFGSLRVAEEGSTRPEGRVLSALLAMPMRPDDLAVALGEDPLTVVKTLTDYELRGGGGRLWDGRYSPTESYLATRVKIGRTERDDATAPRGDG